ncbi:MAG TPA: hypothetical protein VIE63_15895 [Ramlibacter sp.]
MSTILVLGASYGSLLATKLAMAGHRVRLVCSRPTAQLIDREGTVVRFPLKDGAGMREVRSRDLPGRIDARSPDEVEPAGFELVVFAMQEAQYAEASMQRLMRRIAAVRVPCLAIMNMPPPPYLRRIPGIDPKVLDDCYAASDVWRDFDPALVTLASPDPQAFRPADEGKNVLVVGLPTNFKAAVFEDAQATALLRRLARDIEREADVPVKLKVHDSPFVPLAKWPMLVTGNYRCIGPDGMVSIREAVHGDIERSRRIYEWAMDLCCKLGAAREDLVPFEKYAQAAASLQKPSSAARALFGGALHIERVDRLVHSIAVQLRHVNDECRRTVELVDERLQANRAAFEMAAA